MENARKVKCEKYSIILLYVKVVAQSVIPTLCIVSIVSQFNEVSYWYSKRTFHLK
jgi:hypothetical protein